MRSLPGGSLATRALILERSSSVRRGLRPAPGPAPRPSILSALKRWRRFRTILGYQPSSSAILAVRSPFQLRETMRARKIQSPGAWRLPANLWTLRPSSASSGARAVSSFGMILSFPGRRFGHKLMCTAFEERCTSDGLLESSRRCAPRASSIGASEPLRLLWRALAEGFSEPSAVYRVLDTRLIPAIVRVKASRKGLFASQVSFRCSASKT
jgi:hypothetical protein